MFKFDSTIVDQLIAYTPRDMVPGDSDIWLYIDLFDNVDLDNFYARYSRQGQDSVDCRLMLRTLFYGLTHGISSGRKLAGSCRFDNRYMVLSGGYAPHFRTFHRFFVRHEKDIEELFVTIVKLAQEMKLVSLGRIAIDGSRIKANASKKGMIRYNKLDDAAIAIREQISALKEQLVKENHEKENDLETLEKEVLDKERRLERIKAAKDRLDKEYKDEKRKSETRVALNDTDARFMGKDGSAGNYSIGYNCQTSVDSDNQIIVAAEIHDSPQDAPALIPMISKTIENCGDSPKQVLADKGYCTSENIIEAKPYCESLYIGMTNRKGEVPTIRYEHILKGENNTYVCMAGKPLRIGAGSRPHNVSILPDKDRCIGCPLTSSCLLYERRAKQTQILDMDHGQALADMALRNRTEEFQEVYKKRKAIVEPVFGNIKWNKILRLFVTGRRKASAWWKMVCTAHNIEKLIKNMQRIADGAAGPSGQSLNCLENASNCLKNVRYQLQLRINSKNFQFFA